MTKSHFVSHSLCTAHIESHPYAEQIQSNWKNKRCILNLDLMPNVSLCVCGYSCYFQIDSHDAFVQKGTGTGRLCTFPFECIEWENNNN